MLRGVRSAGWLRSSFCSETVIPGSTWATAFCRACFTSSLLLWPTSRKMRLEAKSTTASSTASSAAAAVSILAAQAAQSKPSRWYTRRMCSTSIAFLNVLIPLVENGFDVIVVQGVVHYPSFPAKPHQFSLLQHPQLVGNGRLGQPQQVGQVAHAHFRLEEGVEDADPCGIAKDFKEFSELKEVFFRGHALAHPFHHIFMDHGHIAGEVFLA